MRILPWPAPNPDCVAGPNPRTHAHSHMYSSGTPPPPPSPHSAFLAFILTRHTPQPGTEEAHLRPGQTPVLREALRVYGAPLCVVPNTYNVQWGGRVIFHDDYLRHPCWY